MRLLAVAAAVVIVGLAILLYSVFTDDAPDDGKADPVVATGPGPGPGPGPGTRRVIADARPLSQDLPEGPEPAFPDDADANMDEFHVRGAEFFERIDEYTRQRMPSLVADCYEGGEDRKAKLKLHYRVNIEGHRVSFRDISIVESTLKSEKVKDCMIRTLESASFQDINMPDFVSPENEPETLLIRIEALKRFYPHQEEGTR